MVWIELPNCTFQPPTTNSLRYRRKKGLSDTAIALILKLEGGLGSNSLAALASKT